MIVGNILGGLLVLYCERNEALKSVLSVAKPSIIAEKDEELMFRDGLFHDDVYYRIISRIYCVLNKLS